ncbi:hypothetical protein AGR2A_Cc160114 [Agrobacterium genomosp. 2 str. CFBP 5494]|uniref:Uncharacterized protein n=1 Tax=Agrobacterium genomosp. 2 str. CFBP 5494 TaxID=1183436 RepID=A0A9W5EYQ6_9HYPH|nr:hypothetical protein AGR2A_Cc160114 [Agrobacterium genomosp. 2 str. CFBP 5494]
MVVPTRLAVRTRAGEFVFTAFELSAVGDTGDIASVMVLVPFWMIAMSCLGRRHLR